ncbi:unnamed protein product [Urochloa humidicola]
MLEKRLHGCLLLLVFLLGSASGSHGEETTVDSEEVKRRSLATGSGMFCVASQGADPAALQAGLNWACGPGHADCTAIQPGGPCYKQNNLQAVASYAYNDYYQRSAKTSTACDFNGTATTTTQDPSSGQCVFTGRRRRHSDGERPQRPVPVRTGHGWLRQRIVVREPPERSCPFRRRRESSVQRPAGTLRPAACAAALLLPLIGSSYSNMERRGSPVPGRPLARAFTVYFF